MNRIEIKVRTGDDKPELVSIHTFGVPIIVNYEDIYGDSIAKTKMYDYYNMRIAIKDGTLILEKEDIRHD